MVTFNYDLVVESAHNAYAETPIKVSTPTESGVVHKVHGNVDWIRHDGGVATSHQPFWSIANGQYQAESLNSDCFHLGDSSQSHRANVLE
ncbi:MAG: hypothetical protein JWN04_3231 [Myxococcaceae bacterium]|nr:hypothetical protein [Myxococcaceae bacterium]